LSPARIALLISLLALPTLRFAAQTGPAPPPGAPAQTSPAQPSDAPPQPSSDEITTLHATARLVVLDVVVVDANGDSIHGLKPSDFTLTEDGVPQSLASSTEHGATELAEPTSALPPNTFTIQPPPTEDQPKTVIVLADAASWSPTAEMPEFPNTDGSAVNIGYVRNDINAFLKTAPSTQPVAIVRLDWQGMHLVQSLTADRNVLKEAIASKRMQPPLGFIVRYARARGSAAQQLVRYVQSIPGRVNLVWITYGAGLPGDPFGDFPDLANVVGSLSGSSNVLHLSRVALYPIPLNQQFLGPDSPLAQMARAAGGHLYLTGVRQALTEIAATSSDYYTISYVPTNPNWNGAFRKIQVKVAGFPQPPPPITWSRFWSVAAGWIEDNPSKLIYRGGYFARTNPSPAAEIVRVAQGSSRTPDANRKLLSYSPKGDPAGYGAEAATAIQRAIQRAMQFGSLPLDRIDFTLTATASDDIVRLKPGAPLPGENFLTPLFRQDDYRNVHIQYRVDPHSLTFAQDSLGGYYDSLQFMAVVYRDDGVPVNSIQSNEQVQVSAGGFAGALNSAIAYDQTIAVPLDGNPNPGNFFVRVGVAERPSGHVGTIEIPTEWIKLPPPQSLTSNGSFATTH
jgi:VWFA-related protein